MHPGLNVVYSFSAGKQKVGLIPSLLFTLANALCYWPFQGRSREGGSGRWWGDEEWAGPHDCAVVAQPLWAWEQVLSKVSCWVFALVLRDSHWEHSALLRCGQFSFPVWATSPQSLCSKALIVGLRWSSWEECKLSSCQLTLRFVTAFMSFAPTTGHSLPANLLYSAARGSRKKNQTLKHQSVISSIHGCTLTGALQICQGSPSWWWEEWFSPSLGSEVTVPMLFLRRSVQKSPVL